MQRTELKNKRLQKGMLQKEIADIVGINRSYYGLIETGARNPNYNIACKIAKCLDSTVEEVFPKEFFVNNKCYKM